MIQFLVNNWLWILAVLGIGALVAVFLLAKPVRVGLKTMVTIIGLGLSYKKNSADVPDDVIVSEIKFHCGDREIAANLYRPKDSRKHPAIVLAHGAIKGGKDDRALRFGGQSLASAGCIGLAPQLENLNRLRLHQDDVDALIESVRYLSRQEFCNGKVGLLGACLSAPLVFLAACTPDIKQNVAVITCWGGFYNINEWLQAVLSQHYIEGSEAKPWKPRPLLIEQAPQWLMELSPDVSDRAFLQEIFKGNSERVAKDRLSAYGRSMYELLSNRDPEKVKNLWQKLDPKVRETLDNLSPHTKVDKHSAKIAIIHTFNDDVIPWVESCKLSDALDCGDKVYFRIFRQFYHVSIEDLLKARISNLHHVIAEAAQFYLYMYSILYELS